MEEKIKWKSHYNTKLREAPITGMIKVIISYHSAYFYRSYLNVLRLFHKNPLEIELSKFLVDRKFLKYHKFCFYAGMGTAFLVHFWDNKIRNVLDEVISPGSHLIYHYKLFSYFREKRFQAWSFFDVNMLLLSKKKTEEQKKAETATIDGWKKEYLLAEQITNYNKKRIRDFDFLNIGEQNVYKLV